MIAPAVVRLLEPVALRAHPGLPVQPRDLATAWSLEPTVLLGLALFAVLYVRGVGALWHRAGTGRGLPRWRVGAAAAGLLALVTALVSPVDALGSALFSAHMAQHMLLVLAAAPLLVMGQPEVALLWALPVSARRRLGRWWIGRRMLRSAWHSLAHPASAWMLHAAATWVWHLPGPYQAALSSAVLHAAEHATFLGTALLFWMILPGVGRYPRLSPPLAALSLFAFVLQGGALGALMTFSGTPWYPAYAETTAPWGLTPLDDQQVAGLVMWVPGGLIYAVAAMVPLARWLDTSAAPEPVHAHAHAHAHDETGPVLTGRSPTRAAAEKPRRGAVDAAGRREASPRKASEVGERGRRARKGCVGR